MTKRPQARLSPKLLAAAVAVGLIAGAAISATAEPDAAVAVSDARTLDAAPTPDVTVTTTVELTPPVDVIEDPAGAAAEVLDYARGGRYAVVAFLVLLAMARSLSYAVGKWPDAVGLRALNTAPRRALLVGSAGVLAAVAASLMAGAFDYAAILGALSAAAMLYLTPEPKTEPAK